MAECFGVGLERNMCVITLTTCDSSSGPWILNCLLSSFIDKPGISHDESGMATDILFKPRVEATSTGQTDTKQDISQSKNQRERKISSKWHVCCTWFLFSFYSTPGNIN